MLRPVFAICLSTLLLREVLATTVMDGGKTNKCQGKDGVLPNPDATDCKSYIVCKNGSSEEFQCSTGLLYNPFKMTCDYNTSIACDDGEAIQIVETSHNIPSSDMECETETCSCVYPGQHSCSQYYFCVRGVAYEEKCPRGLIYNANKFTCDYEENVDCLITVPTTVSESTDKEHDDIPDCSEVDCSCLYPSKLDCAAYYMCEDGEAHVYSCSPGLLFNEKTRTCDYDYNVYCKNTATTSTIIYSTKKEKQDEDSTAISFATTGDDKHSQETDSTISQEITSTVTEQTSPRETLFPHTSSNDRTSSPFITENEHDERSSSHMPVTATTIEANETISEITEITDEIRFTDTEMTTAKTINETFPETTELNFETTFTNEDFSGTQTSAANFSENPENITEATSTNEENTRQSTEETREIIYKTTGITDEGTSIETKTTEILTKETDISISSIFETESTSSSTFEETSGTIFDTTKTSNETKSTNTENSKATTSKNTNETTKIPEEITYSDTEGSRISTTIESINETTEAISEATPTNTENSKISTIKVTTESINETTEITNDVTFTDAEHTKTSTTNEITENIITTENINETTKITNDVTFTDAEHTETSLTNEITENINETTEITNGVTFTDAEHTETSTTNEITENINETTEITNDVTFTDADHTKATTTNETTDIITTENINNITSTDTGDSKATSTKETTKNFYRTTKVTDEDAFTNTEVSKTDISEEPLETTVEEKITDDKSTNYFENSTTSFAENDSTIISNSTFTTEQDFSSEPNIITSNITYETKFTEFSTESTNMTTADLSISESVITESPDLQKSTTVATASINDLEDTTYSRQETTNNDIATESVITENSMPDETYSVITEDDLHNFTCPSRFGLFPHPEKCTQFYQCSHWIPYLMECSDGLHFNPELQVCDWPYAAGCENKTATSTQVYSTHKDKDLATTISSSTNIETTQKILYTTVSDLISTDIDIISREYTTFEKSSLQTDTEKTSPSSTMQTIFDKYASTVEIGENISEITENTKEIKLNTETIDNTDTIYTKNFETTTKRYSDKDTSLNFTTTDEADFSTEPNIVTDNKIVNTNGTTLIQGLTTEFSKQPNTTTDFWTTSTNESLANYTSTSSTKSLPSENNTTEMSTEIPVNTTYNRETTISKVTVTKGYTSKRTSSDETFVTTTVEISRDFECPSQFGLFPHPKNCNQFYQCSQWVAYRMKCPSSLHFNAELQVCDWPYEAGCENKSDSSTFVYSTEDLTNKDIILSTLQPLTEAENNTKKYTTIVKETTSNEKETTSRETFRTETTLSHTNNDDNTRKLDEQTTSYIPITTTREKFANISEENFINETTGTGTPAYNKITDTSNTKSFETTTDFISDKDTTDLFISTIIAQETSTEPDMITNEEIIASYETTIAENLTTNFQKETTAREEITDTVNTKNYETTISKDLTVNSTPVTTPNTPSETFTLPTKDRSTNFETTSTRDSKTNFSNETTVIEKTTDTKYSETTTETYAKDVTNSTLPTIVSNEPNIISTKSTMTTSHTKLTENSNYDSTNKPTATTIVKLLTSGTTFISSTQSSSSPNVTIEMTTAKPESSTGDKENVTFYRETTVDHLITGKNSTDKTFLNITTDIPNDFTCPKRFGLFPDPEDCSLFYECSQWTAYHIQCPPNLHFNPTLQVCDYPYEAGCANELLTKTTAISSTDVDSTVGDTKTNSITPTTTSTVLTSTKVFSPEIISSTQKSRTSPISTILTVTVSSKKEITDDDLQNMTDSTFYITTAANISNESITETTDKEIMKSTKDLNTESTSYEITQSITTTDTDKLFTNTSKNSTISTKSIFEIFSTIVDLKTNTEPETITSGTSTIPTTEDISKESTSKRSDFECPSRFGLYPDPKECSKFYECYQWISSHMSCPPNLHFNPTLKVCDWPYEAGCDVSA